MFLNLYLNLKNKHYFVQVCLIMVGPELWSKVDFKGKVESSLYFSAHCLAFN